MRFILFCISLCSVLHLALAQQPASIYNDDPTQRLPVGMEKPTHRFISAAGKTVDSARVEPPYWWTGLPDTKLEVMIYDQSIGAAEVAILSKNKVKLLNSYRVQNPNYKFVELDLSKASPGEFEIILKLPGGTNQVYPYTLEDFKPKANAIQGINGSDLIYLVMPDRFANGDTLNDDIKGMQQRGINRDKMFFRHGGDIQGVIDHLDYIKDLGATAIWLNPVIENNQPYESYHGYAMTDLYKIDARLGTNEVYRKLVDTCHQMGIKVIMDIVHNHVGDKHWMIQDLPAENWIHQWDTYTGTTYKDPTLMDPYASAKDKSIMTDGWFDVHMPDLNQQHPRLARYLIQNNLWWTAYSGHDAYRVDTYAYPDQAFMSDWGAAMQKNFPNLGLFAETWVHGKSNQAQYTQNNHLRKGYNSHMPAVTDFQLYYAINDALTKPQGWTDGISKIYYTLSQDYLYENPFRNVVFLDNHDLSRFFSVICEDTRKFRSGIAFLMTTRGIPMLYYGTEVLMKNFSDPDGKVREDFQGGWSSDRTDKFTLEGRSAEEQAAFEYVQKLAQYRKTCTALQSGSLKQFVPVDGVYVYFRQDVTKTVMVVMNTHDKTQSLDLKRFNEVLCSFMGGVDVVSGEALEGLSTLSLSPFEAKVIELK